MALRWWADVLALCPKRTSGVHLRYGGRAEGGQTSVLCHRTHPGLRRAVHRRRVSGPQAPLAGRLAPLRRRWRSPLAWLYRRPAAARGPAAGIPGRLGGGLRASPGSQGCAAGRPLAAEFGLRLPHGSRSQPRLRQQPRPNRNLHGRPPGADRDRYAARTRHRHPKILRIGGGDSTAHKAPGPRVP